MAKPSPDSRARPRLLVLELWGLGDLALAMPFLRTATEHADVTLLAKPHAAPLLAHFAPQVAHVPFTAPWTAFTGKYRLHRWPWAELRRVRKTLRAHRFDVAVSARHDPRDHLLLALAGAPRRIGFARAGSQCLLTENFAAPSRPHRSEYWSALASTLGWARANTSPPPRPGRRVVMQTGAGQPVRVWPRERFEALATRLRAAGWETVMLDDTSTDLEALIATLAGADRFIGNDSGPGHIAAQLGVPTFTIFGPQLPERFAPQHPQAAWVEGAPCLYKPCFDQCRFTEPHCIMDLDLESVAKRVAIWLDSLAS